MWGRLRILFCKVAYMKRYQGVSDDDKPYNGGSWVTENEQAYEEYNFLPITVTDSPNEQEINQKINYGFVETKHTKEGYDKELHIEKISGCELLKKAPYVDDVLVIWCATMSRGVTRVVGWYKHATVYRTYESYILECDNKEEEERSYNIKAKSDNCYLLPELERKKSVWDVPNAAKSKSFGFGQSLVWYARQESAKQYLDDLIKNINEYQGETCLAECSD